MTLKDPSLEPVPGERVPPQRVQFCAAEAEPPTADLAIGEFSGRVASDADGAIWTVYIDTKTQYGSGTAVLALVDSGLSDDEQAELQRMLLVCRDTAYERNGLPKVTPPDGGGLKVG